MRAPAFMKTGSGAVFIVDGRVVAEVKRPSDYDPWYAGLPSDNRTWFIVDAATGEARLKATTLRQAERMLQEQYA